MVSPKHLCLPVGGTLAFRRIGVHSASGNSSCRNAVCRFAEKIRCVFTSLNHHNIYERLSFHEQFLNPHARVIIASKRLTFQEVCDVLSVLAMLVACYIREGITFLFIDSQNKVRITELGVIGQTDDVIEKIFLGRPFPFEVPPFSFMPQIDKAFYKSA